MPGIASSPYFDSYLYSQNLRFPNWSFNHALIFMQSLDWTLEEMKYCVFMICYDLQAGAYQSPIELLSTDSDSDSLSLRALLMEIGSKSILRYRFLVAQTYKLVKM
jgi:hypothetical protein